MRNRGVGELLLVAMIHRATEVGARWMTLEVRASNERAQRLYEWFGFSRVGTLRGYYSDIFPECFGLATFVLLCF
jgi:ribosomal-protein-alanine N-acetyltransferase